MAIARNIPKCPLCGEPTAKAIHRKAKGFIGDTFVRWEMIPHNCEGLDEYTKEVEKMCDEMFEKEKKEKAYIKSLSDQLEFLAEKIIKRDIQIKEANDFILDIAKLLGEDDLGLDGKQWSIDDFKKAIENKSQQYREALEKIVGYVEDEFEADPIFKQIFKVAQQALKQQPNE